MRFLSLVKTKPQQRVTDLRADELQQRGVDGQQLNVCADGGLVERAGFAVQLVQAHLADSVATAEAYGPPHRLLERLRADGTQQELGPLRRLDGHRHRNGLHVRAKALPRASHETKQQQQSRRFHWNQKEFVNNNHNESGNVLTSWRLITQCRT